MARLATPGSPVRTVVAELDGRPVASAVGIVLGESVAIYNIATLEEARGRGIGRAVTIAVLRDAMARGARFGVLESFMGRHPVHGDPCRHAPWAWAAPSLSTRRNASGD